MKFDFKISLATIIFSLYIIVSASYMGPLLDFIRYDLWIPKKIKTNDFNLYLKNAIKDKHRDILKRSYYKLGNNYYLKKNMKKEDKIDVRIVLLNAGRQDILDYIVWSVFILSGLILTVYIIKNKIELYRVFILFFVLALGLLYAVFLNGSISERIHLVYFAILGILFSMDNMRQKGLYTILYTVIFSLFIATLDEIFQLILPYRVGDVRDIIFGTAGGLWGSLIYLSMKYKKAVSNRTIP